MEALGVGANDVEGGRQWVWLLPQSRYVGVKGSPAYRIKAEDILEIPRPLEVRQGQQFGVSCEGGGCEVKSRGVLKARNYHEG